MRWPKLIPSWPHLVGPLFRFELIRLARSGRFFWLRGLYALALLGLLWLGFQRWAKISGWGQIDDFRTVEWFADQMGQLAEQFTQSLLIVQIAAVLLLAPLYLATSITEERSQGTLELLFTTHLHSREIILGKFLARSLILAALLLAGLPILTLIHFLGGVNLWLVLGGFVIAVVAILQAGSVSIFCSTLARGSTGAVVASYGLLVLTMVCCILPPVSPVSNPFMGLLSLDEHLRKNIVFPLQIPLPFKDSEPLTLIPVPAGAGPAWVLLLFLVKYGLYQGTLALLFLGLAIRNLRQSDPPTILELAARERKDEVRPSPVLPPLPTISHVSMPSRFVHREMREDETDPLWGREAPSPGRPVAFTFYVLFFAFSFYVGILVLSGLCSVFFEPTRLTLGSHQDLTSFVIIYDFCAFGGVAVLEMLRIVSCISQERQQRTLECLLTLPLERSKLLRIKLLAGYWFFRWIGLMALALTLFGVAAGAVHPVIALLALAAGVIHALFFMVLGLWLSISCRTSLQAKLTLGVIVFALTVAPLLLLPAQMHNFQLPINPLQFWIFLALEHPFDPPRSGFIVLHADEPFLSFEEQFGKSFGVVWCVLGLVLYGLATWILWRWSCHRFETDPLGKTG